VTVAPPGRLGESGETAHLAKVHEAERLVDEVSQTREALRDEARRTLGVTGDDSKAPPLREALRSSGVSIYPMSILGLLYVVDTFQVYGFDVLRPEISRSLGIGIGTIGALTALQFLAIAVAPLSMAAYVQRRPRRALVCIITATLWAIACLYTGFVTSLLGLAVVLTLDGLSSGSVAALHQPLLLDSYPPQARVRALSFYGAVGRLGNVVAPLGVALLAGVFDFTWRGVFLVFGITCLAVLPLTLWLRDPGFGKYDTEQLRASVHELHGDQEQLSDDDVALGFFEIVRRLLLVPTIRRLLLAFAVFGMLLIPYNTVLSFYLDENLGFGPGQRGLFFAGTSAAGVVALAIFGKRGEQLFRKSPGRVVELAGLLLALGVVLIVTATLVHYVVLTVLMFAMSSAVIAVLGPALGIALLSVVPSRMRPHASALYGIFLGGVGGIAGALLLGGVSNRYGLTGAMVSLLVPGVLGSLLLRSCGKYVAPDLDRMIDEVLEDEEIKRITASGGRLPMLSSRGIDFSYGQLQVLFDVDFTVDDGEMVALLGTNGAGKSTLLKVISGIGLPTAGSVRFRGQDITYLDAERRTKLGITQIPGGRAVFGPLTVVENLRSYGYSLGKDRRNLNALIDECFEAFPRLAERRNSLASTLSGGEQQMLGLSKALVMKPRLLVIDELSLGLAPIIVEQLLEMVRQINATGTAVVLVEQSVNIALSLVEHAYFMEKGEMRFDGAAADLLARNDLLRAVFLEGSSAHGGAA
jgi:ABC-type branched-subunit amino acid transport system ATPase component/sugar phosphate permease